MLQLATEHIVTLVVAAAGQINRNNTMKTYLLALTAVLLVGCSNLTQQECNDNVKRYNAYLALLEKGEYISPEQIKQAKLAAEALQLSCGWLPVAKHRVFTAQDDNGVPLIAKPR